MLSAGQEVTGAKPTLPAALPTGPERAPAKCSTRRSRTVASSPSVGYLLLTKRTCEQTPLTRRGKGTGTLFAPLLTKLTKLIPYSESVPD
jgi:hypothetical protein